MKKLLVIAACTLCMLMMFGCGNGESKEAAKTTVAGTEISSTTYDTPYGKLSIPETYVNNVNIEVVSEDPYTIAFYEKNSGAKLYTIYYGEEKELCLGTLETDGETVTMYVEFAELDEQAEGYELCVTLQSDINEILDALEVDGNFSKGEK